MGYSDGVKHGEWNKEQKIKELITKVEQWKREAIGRRR
jgi:hypothetical protein